MYRQRRRSSRLTEGARGAVTLFALFLAVGLLLYQLLSSVLVAFSISSWTGVRSLAAALFPLLVAIYLGFLARLQTNARESRAPVVNNFIIFLFWTMLLLGIDGRSPLERFPLEELLYSFTLSAMIWRYKRGNTMGALMACCYGVLAGSLAGLIFFGINPAAM
ncbi:hypothetical protein PN498_23360 [Oscillatoria sp. CS-180]|uniref:hypothetical protein n=1 Tax=Oscillatoria sp. CS-180 TaxID=3021720 RepID=UPI00232FB6B0|nr:hypothetical protein [Oscillatoria sp. CS-180]MDB9528951.1 hypothetical protein [Oscillatoria sp. CS-180]